MIRNYWLFSGLIIMIFAFVPLVFYVIPKQFAEVRRPRNEFTRLRKLVFLAEVFLVLAMVPGVPRSIQTLGTPPVNNYAKVAAITNRVPYFATMVILVLIYNYRSKDE